MPKAFNAFVIASVIVRDGDRFLLLEEDRLGQRMLNMPGGRMNPNEVPSETACRETREETGIDVRMGALVGVVQGTWADGALFAKFIFEGERVGGEERAEKTAKIHWLTAEQLLDPKTLPAPILPVDEALLREYLSEKKAVTPFFYRYGEDGFERA